MHLSWQDYMNPRSPHLPPGRIAVEPTTVDRIVWARLDLPPAGEDR